MPWGSFPASPVQSLALDQMPTAVLKMLGPGGGMDQVRQEWRLPSTPSSRVAWQDIVQGEGDSQVQIPALLFPNSVLFFNLIVPQFSHLSDGANNYSYLLVCSKEGDRTRVIGLHTVSPQ